MNRHEADEGSSDGCQKNRYPTTDSDCVLCWLRDSPTDEWFERSAKVTITLLLQCRLYPTRALRMKAISDPVGSIQFCS
jgi:hypothetical protein